MSEQIQTILNAVRDLDSAQRQELLIALAGIEVQQPKARSTQQKLVDSVKGKYRHIPTSSESFLSRKREDAAMESGH